MKPLRLFVVLVLLTASALAIVYFRVASVRIAYSVQLKHGEQWDLLRKAGRQRVEIARLTNLRLVSDAVRKTNLKPRQWEPTATPTPTNGNTRDDPAARGYD